MHMKMFGQEFADGFVRRSIYRRSLDFDLVAPVREFHNAFALAPGMYLDVYSHKVLGEHISRCSRASLQLFLHALVIFHGRQKFFLASDQGAAADEIVCT